MTTSTKGFIVNLTPRQQRKLEFLVRTKEKKKTEIIRDLIDKEFDIVQAQPTWEEIEAKLDKLPFDPIPLSQDEQMSIQKALNEKGKKTIIKAGDKKSLHKFLEIK